MKLTYKSIIILMGWMCELHTVQKSLTLCTKTEPVTVRADAMYSVYIVKVCIYIPVYLAFVYILYISGTETRHLPLHLLRVGDRLIFIQIFRLFLDNAVCTRLFTKMATQKMVHQLVYNIVELIKL